VENELWATKVCDAIAVLRSAANQHVRGLSTASNELCGLQKNMSRT